MDGLNLREKHPQYFKLDRIPLQYKGMELVYLGAFGGKG
jgi:hypothetical protein